MISQNIVILIAVMIFILTMFLQCVIMNSGQQNKKKLKGKKGMLIGKYVIKKRIN